LDVVLWTEAEGGQMARKGHSEEQIITALRQVEAGKKVSDVCRRRPATSWQMAMMSRFRR
jgi:hypothetical protein